MVIRRQANILIKLGILKTPKAASDRLECKDCTPLDSTHYKYCQLGSCLPKRSQSCCQYCKLKEVCSGVCASIITKKVAKKIKLGNNTVIGPIWRD